MSKNVMRKDDPVYYKVELSKLIKQALAEKLSVQCQHLKGGIRITFVADNGEAAGIELTDNNS